ncbi:hypothetical protein, partial [Streptomyces sp. NPDC006997]|uniref:hypothetical protein n=1 Tax=Streptomyces sp. NPDC006997 TaxID=3155356 RepID=UPI0033F804AB
GTAGRGKSTRSGTQPFVGDATHAPSVLPHLPYAYAVLDELTVWTGAGLEPSRADAGVRRESGGPRELYLTAVWEPEHPDLNGDLWPEGMTVSWSHLTGWAADDGTDVRALDGLDPVAPPELVADAVLHLAVFGLHTAWVPPIGGRWARAGSFDGAMNAWREATGS